MNFLREMASESDPDRKREMTARFAHRTATSPFCFPPHAEYRFHLFYGGYTKEKAAETVSVWSFVKKHPECDGITSHAVADYTTYCEKAGVPAKTFYQAWKHKNTLSGTVKAPMMEYINGLNLSRSQKDSLYYAFGWAESTIDEAPWH